MIYFVLNFFLNANINYCSIIEDNYIEDFINFNSIHWSCLIYVYCYSLQH